ncbi:MAG: CvpA family protein [Weeksellaceae bacterium]
MNYLDWFFLITLGYGAIRGFRTGLINSVMSLLAIGLSIWIGFQFSDFMLGVVRKIDFIPEEFVSVAAIVLTIGLVYFALKLLGRFVTGATKAVGLGLFNRIGGTVFGLIINSLVLSAMLIYLTPFIPEEIYSELTADSKIMPYLGEIIKFYEANSEFIQNTLKDIEFKPEQSL